MSVELSDISLRIYKLYRPYFGLKAEQLFRTIALGMVVIGNVSLAVVFGFINTTMSALFGVLQQPGITYSAFFASFNTALWYFGVYFVISFVKDKFLDFLQSSLSHAIDMDLVERWAKNKAFYGIKFLPNKNKPSSKNAKAFKDDTDEGEDEDEELNPAQIMSYDNADLIVNMTYVVDHFLSASCTFIVAMISLYALSAPLTFTLYSMSVTIPGYIAIASLGYSIVVNMLISYVGKPLKAAEAKIKKAQSILYRKTSEIMQHAESIAFLKGSEFEYQQLKSVIQDARIFKDASAKIRLMINSIVNMNYTINQFVPMLFSLPNIVAQKMSVDSLFEVIPNFQAVVDLLTWKNQNYEVLALSEVSLTRIEKFSELLKQWEDEQSATQKNQLKFETNSQQNTFVIKNLTVLKPDKKPAFKDVNFSLEKGTSSLIEGKSGAGKTTLIRAVAQLWPYLQAGGEIKLPHALAKVIFIPQSGFVYHQGDSLLDTILYPDKVPASSALVHELKSMLKKMGFKNEIVRDLEKVKDWKSELSGGEKQRIAIISAIVKNPDVLFMDESTSALDHSTKEKVITVIKNKLPNCAIGIVDHNPNDTFIDKRVSIDAKRKRS